MKKLLKLILISAIFITPTTGVKAADDIADDLFATKFKDEIIFDANSNISSSKTTDIEEVEAKPEKIAIDTVETQNEKIKVTPKNLFKFDLTNTETDDNIMDNTELDFKIFELFDQDKNDDGEIDKDTLFGKIVHSDIRRTDVPSYLYKDDLTFKFKEGPISRLQTYGAYRGSMNFKWLSNTYTTDYDNLTTQIGMYGQFRNPNYKFKIAMNPIPTSGTSYIERFFSDAYIVNTKIPNHQIVAGYSRVQTGVEGGTSTYILPFVARSQIAKNFGGGRALAVKAIGNYEYVDYNISVGSAGRYITSGMPGAEFNGWVNFKPLGNKSKKYGKVTIGGGYNGGHNQVNYSVLSGYLGYHHKKLWSNFEVAIADGYNGSKGPSSNKACGYTATVGWKFNKHIQLLGRVDQFDPNRDISNNLQREYTVGINWFIRGQALKVILNYVFCDNQNRPNSHKIILATQILL